MSRLVLWDIDHTLITTGGVGRELSAAAFRQTTGVEMREQAAIDGITEAVIFRETAALHGLRTNRSDFERFAGALADQHRIRLQELRDRGAALPGAGAALDAVAKMRTVTQTVVSGNVRAVAEIKLRAFGLAQHIQWDLGAYGEDADERPDLVGLSLQRADCPPQDAVLIGDTPADVKAGLACGVRVIAVATGSSSSERLRQSGARTVLEDLADTKRLTSLVTSV
jgi:phosphoglycolate phosphatase